MQRDMLEANLPYCDDSGRYYDFHSLRVQVGTSLARADVSLKKAQELMRHSTPLLTAKIYSKLQTTDLSEALNQISVPKFVSDSSPKNKTA